MCLRQGADSGHPHMVAGTSLWKKAFKEHSFICVLRKEAPHALSQMNITVPRGAARQSHHGRVTWEGEIITYLSHPTQSVCTNLGSCKPCNPYCKTMECTDSDYRENMGASFICIGVDPGILITVQWQVNRRFLPLPIGPNRLLNPLILLPPPWPPQPLNSSESATWRVPIVFVFISLNPAGRFYLSQFF